MGVSLSETQSSRCHRFRPACFQVDQFSDTRADCRRLLLDFRPRQDNAPLPVNRRLLFPPGDQGRGLPLSRLAEGLCHSRLRRSCTIPPLFVIFAIPPPWPVEPFCVFSRIVLLVMETNPPKFNTPPPPSSPAVFFAMVLLIIVRDPPLAIPPPPQKDLWC
jgi:hypothetical protein